MIRLFSCRVLGKILLRSNLVPTVFPADDEEVRELRTDA